MAGKDQMHTTSIPAGDLEKQQDKAPEKQSESVNESATEVNLTIVVCNGDSSGAHETVEVAQIYGQLRGKSLPKRFACPGTPALTSSVGQLPSLLLLRRFH